MMYVAVSDIDAISTLYHNVSLEALMLFSLLLFDDENNVEVVQELPRYKHTYVILSLITDTFI